MYMTADITELHVVENCRHSGAPLVYEVFSRNDLLKKRRPLRLYAIKRQILRLLTQKSAASSEFLNKSNGQECRILEKNGSSDCQHVHLQLVDYFERPMTSEPFVLQPCAWNVCSVNIRSNNYLEGWLNQLNRKSEPFFQHHRSGNVIADNLQRRHEYFGGFSCGFSTLNS
ncbi:hypothetical protein T11_7830 [Trichinella zimbabwensis]|uniref:Uncharacterized protein n=1 Tax=Trichinella zimbabwensis TaxID=268475 RepID=A0A0V1I2X7_9BILA|nr:hypothetical protein T11_7830 [Trichinella zimbabwensis]